MTSDAPWATWTLEQLLLRAPVGLMLIIFVHQRWRVSALGQNPWKGGGFGMFSDIYRNSVVPQIWISNEAGEQVALKPDAVPWTSRVNSIPSRRNLEQWANELIRARWRRTANAAQRVPESLPDEGAIAVRVSLLHLVIGFDAKSGCHRATPLKSYTVGSNGSASWTYHA